MVDEESRAVAVEVDSADKATSPIFRAGRVDALGRDVFRDLGQSTAVDLVKEAVQVDMLRHCRAVAKELNVVLD